MQYLGGKFLKGREYLHNRAGGKDGNCDVRSAGSDPEPCVTSEHVNRRLQCQPQGCQSPLPCLCAHNSHRLRPSCRWNVEENQTQLH